jgi:putative MATE family efflux protein
VTGQAIVLAACMGLAGAAGVLTGAPVLTSWFDLSPATAELSVRFIRIGACGYAIEAMTFAGAACLRGAGDTRTPMVVLGLVNMVNVAASWTLALGAGLGSDGIAAGTLLARLAGGGLMLWVLVRGRGGVWLSLAAMRPRLASLHRIVRIGAPAALDGLLMWGGHFAFLRIVTHSGGGFARDTLFAAHMVGVRIESLSYLPATAWGLAAATLVGQNLGARMPDRARRCAREAVRQTVMLLSLLGLIYFLFAPILFRLLSGDARVIECGVPALRGLALVQPALAVLIVYIWSLRGAGDTTFPVLFTLTGMVLLRIPVSYVGGVVLEGALVGAWCGMYADLLVRAVLMAARFRGGRWIRLRV